MNVLGSPARYRFGGFELQPRERRLLVNGVATHVGPRALDLLVALVEQAGHLVSKDALFAQVWPKVVVDDSALQAQISALRKILGAGAIATVSGTGYRFVLPLDLEAACEAAPPRHNLPAPQSSFIGREAELARLERALDRVRLVTLTGAGGCGKTRLALQVAAAVAGRYRDGVCRVELASLADAALLPQTVLTALDPAMQPGEQPLATLVAQLESRHCLLLLDNAEHLLVACAELADTLLRECRELSLLVTSREKLNLAGEMASRVPSLSLPEAGPAVSPEQLLASEAARLFVDRARLLRPHFAATPENAPALASICRRLDGIPLAIELAAGRMRSMPVEELDQRLAQRFSPLGAQPRQRTLRALIDWSHDLLSPAEQAMLGRVAVFAGGCTLQAAEQVCVAESCNAAPQAEALLPRLLAPGTGAGAAQQVRARSEVLDLLASLVDKHLMVAEEHDHGTRYRLPEPVLACARERLQESGEAALWQGRHLAHFLALTEQDWPLQQGPGPRSGLDLFELEINNLRAALTCALASRETAESGTRFIVRMIPFWTLRGRQSEARRWAAEAIAAAPPDGDTALRALLLDAAGMLALPPGDCMADKGSFERSLAQHRQPGDPIGAVSAPGSKAAVAALQDQAGAETLRPDPAP